MTAKVTEAREARTVQRLRDDLAVLLADPAVEVLDALIAAAKDEGRAAGLEEAARECESRPIVAFETRSARGLARSIRALASKPSGGVTGPEASASAAVQATYDAARMKAGDK